MEYYIAIAVTVAFLAMILWAIAKVRSAGADPASGEKVTIPDDTRQMPEISEDFQIPEEDQQYLIPITVEVLKKLAFSKRMYPTNGMMIEHLAEALGEAADRFEPRKNNSEDPQIGNEAWLFVAAFAIRLYDEGTPHNCTETREAFKAQATLAERRVKRWAARLNDEIARKVKEGVMGEEAVRNVTSHISTVEGTPYTTDEIEDMKRGFEDDQGPDFMRSVRGD